MNKTPDIEAEIRFLTTDEGGRSSPVFSGYRPDHDFGSEEGLNCAVHEYIDMDEVVPGGLVVAWLTFAIPKFQFGRLYEGLEFVVQEGTQVVARGKVTKILNCKLRRPHS